MRNHTIIRQSYDSYDTDCFIQVRISPGSHPTVSLPLPPHGEFVIKSNLFEVSKYKDTFQVSKTRPFEYLRLTSLGVIGALVKTDEQEVSIRYIFIKYLSTLQIFSGDQLPADDGDHPAVSPHHGVWLGAEQDRGHLHPPEDPPGRDRPLLHLPDLRQVLFLVIFLIMFN